MGSFLLKHLLPMRQMLMKPSRLLSKVNLTLTSGIFSLVRSTEEKPTPVSPPTENQDKPGVKTVKQTKVDPKNEKIVSLVKADEPKKVKK
jgi:hypothetical protein